ncbi:hypothetical protein JXB02_02545 [Candidatus Woesearchaeota archaeon]|nr:hypothetical protein [Candidatus Woesearchaeota archaeon]
MFLFPDHVNIDKLKSELTELMRLIREATHAQDINRPVLDHHYIASIQKQVELCEEYFYAIERQFESMHKLIQIVRKDEAFAQRLMNDLQGVAKTINEHKIHARLFDARQELLVKNKVAMAGGEVTGVSRGIFDELYRDSTKILGLLDDIRHYDLDIQGAAKRLRG